MKKTKIVLAAIMAASAVAGCCTYPMLREFAARTVLTADAASTTDGWQYSTNETYCTITGTTSALVGDVEIPASITLSDGVTTLPVTQIGVNSLRGNSMITGLTIPEGVTKIGDYAISECKNLAKVKLPKSLLVIGGSAFAADTALETVEISEGTVEIGEYAFSGCSSLKKVNFPDSLTTIGRDAFHSCTSLTSVKIPAKVKEPGPWVFAECTALESVTIADGVQKISALFDGCTNLEDLSFPPSVSELNYPFDENCKYLRYVTIENPDCEIMFRGFSAEEQVKVWGYEGSTAEAYVNSLGEQDHVVFEAIGEKPVKPEVPDTGDFCDADGDGKITAGDAQYVLIYATEAMTGNNPSWRELTGNEKAPE